ncbi:MAG: DUF1080 domain-containing protein [Bryobacterales bacterium]|nr:DUF1080 domain-containing protein [Bryobacterales bacterium]
MGILCKAVLVLLVCLAGNVWGQQSSALRDSAFFGDSPAWRSLFDGRDLSGWRFLHDKEIDPRFWRVEDGVLRTLPGGQWGADIITREAFGDFAFCAEWKVAAGGNAGILYNVREDQWRGQDSVPARVRTAWLTLGGAVLLGIILLFARRGFLRHDMARGLVLGLLAVFLAHTLGPFERLLAYAHYMENWKAAGLEMQLFDDDHFAGATMEPSHGNGALYDIFPPTSREGKAAGEWNESCVVVDGREVEHWMNGVRVLRYQLQSAELERAVARSRYRSIQGLTRKAPMRVALQNHDGQQTWFRNLRVRLF